MPKKDFTKLGTANKEVQKRMGFKESPKKRACPRHKGVLLEKGQKCWFCGWSW